jgi:HK97 family phage major capsid protein
MLKALIEKRNALITEMEGLVATVKTETRAFNETEAARIEAIKTEIAGIDNTIKIEEEVRSMDKKTETKTTTDVEVRALEEANFLKFVRGEERALTVADNGGVIPTTIANKIIEKVKELSPIYAMATVYNVGGDLVFPVYDESSSSIGAAYSDDLAELTEGTGKFTTVKLQNFIVGSLAKISKSLINRTDFDLVSFVVSKVAKAIAEFLEKELINGTTNKMTGVLSATQTVTSSTAGKVDFDDVIDLMDEVPEVYQAKSVFIMNKSTRKAIRKLKDLEGNYILNKDATTAFGYSIFGKPVYVTESMPAFEAGAKAIVYGDMSGLYVKLAQNVEIQMLMEKYATQHAIGAVGYVEADSKIVEPQKLAVLTVKAA